MTWFYCATATQRTRLVGVGQRDRLFGIGDAGRPIDRLVQDREWLVVEKKYPMRPTSRGQSRAIFLFYVNSFRGYWAAAERGACERQSPPIPWQAPQFSLPQTALTTLSFVT